MTDPGLSKVYQLRTVADAEVFYDDWATGYEDELGEQGYVTPQRCAEALAMHTDVLDAPLADVGCGTGLGGLALRASGFGAIDGYDLSAEMLAKATEKGVYRETCVLDLTGPLDALSGRNYHNIAAIGVFNPNFLSPMILDQLLDLLPIEGCFVFSLNDHALAEGSFPLRVLELTEHRCAELLVKEHGAHIPGTGLESTVYLLRKC